MLLPVTSQVLELLGPDTESLLIYENYHLSGTTEGILITGTRPINAPLVSQQPTALRHVCDTAPDKSSCLWGGDPSIIYVYNLLFTWFLHVMYDLTIDYLSSTYYENVSFHTFLLITTSVCLAISLTICIIPGMNSAVRKNVIYV